MKKSRRHRGESREPYRCGAWPAVAPHPAAAKAINSIGFALCEPKANLTGTTLEASRVYSLRADAVGGGAGDAALLSAMIAPKPSAADILWIAPP